MKSSVRRTELLAFWYWTENESAPSRPMSNPASRSTRALRSSRALHQMNSWTSGWSTSSMTILAARRVVPPDLMVPAEASAPRMKLTGPLGVPPPLKCSRDERSLERLAPAPDPPLKMTPSSSYHLRMERRSSSTSRMKQAAACWATPGTPMLNQTGELNDTIWCSSRNRSSSAKTWASASSAKWPSRRPHAATVPTTRSISWRSDDSRRGEPDGPRKYFWATMLEALTDQATGNSTPSCSNATLPSR